MKYVFTGTLKKTVITSFSLLRPLDGGHLERGGGHLVEGYLCAQLLLPVLSLSIVIVSLFNIYV